MTQVDEDLVNKIARWMYEQEADNRYGWASVNNAKNRSQMRKTVREVLRIKADIEAGKVQ